MTSPSALFRFIKILFFWVVRREGVKRAKTWPRMTKNSVSLLILGTAPHVIVVFRTCVKWWYLQQIFSFLQKSDISGFSKFINNSYKEIPRCVPHSSHGCDFVVKLWFILPWLELSRTELPKCTPNCSTMENCDHTNCPVLPVLFIWPSQYGLAFWKVYLWARSFL